MSELRDLGIADLVRALAALEPRDVAARDAIAGSLGLSASIRQTDGAQVSAFAGAIVAPGRPMPAREPPAPAAGVPPRRVAPVPTTQNDGMPDWLGAPPLDVDSGESSHAALVKFEPLFKREWTPGILRHALAVSANEGSVDVSALCSAVARMRPLRTMPRRSRRILRRGVQLLSDMGDGMTPYAGDQIHLIEQVTNLLGSALVQLAFFADTPFRVAGTRARRRVHYQPPEFGVPVLVVSDLGIAGRQRSDGRRQAQEWLEFGRLLRRRRSKLLLLVPYPRQRWPSPRVPDAHYIEWDRRSGVTSIFRELRPH
jgi:hypothetical protein